MRKTILVIDDDPEFLDTITPRLEAAGYRVRTAVDGEEGLAKARAERPDLILLDIVMPVMDGFDVLTRIRAGAATSRIPVIILTARGETKFVFKAEELGANGYLVKPLEAEELLRLAAKHTGQAQEPAQ